MTKRILIVIDNLGSGGAQNQITLLAQLLQQRHYDVECLTYHHADFFKFRLDEFNIPVHLVQKKSKIGLSIIQAIGKIVRSKKIDLVISFLQTPSFYSAIAKKVYHNQKPLLISERFISFEKKGSIKYRLKKLSHKIASFASTNSNHERLRLIKLKITNENKIKTIYNLVNLQKFKPIFNHVLTYKLLCVASVSPYKNGLCVVEAMHLLAKNKQLNFKLSWVGSKVYDIPERASYIKEMEDKIIKYNLTGFWEWVTPTKNILPYYQSHDALVHPSYREGLPNVVCESLACGLPVILSDTLDHPDLADHGNNGFLFNYKSPEDLAQSILKFYQTTDERKQQLRTNCRNFAEKQFSEDRFIGSYLEIINSISLHD